MSFLDPALDHIAKEQAAGRMPFVVPQEFYRKYDTMPDGSQRETLMVRVMKKGQQNATITPYRWKDLEKNPADPLYQVLKPYYDNFLRGETTPINGVPLEAWLADAALVKVLAGVNIRSVEDVAGMEDSSIQKLNLPKLREIQKNARAFLEARATTAPIAAENAKLKEDLALARSEIGDLRALIEEHVKKVEEEEPRRGPGRPRKVVEAA